MTVRLHDGAVGEGLRTLAAKGVEAVTLLLLDGAEVVNELTVLKVATTGAVVMDGLVEHELGLIVVVELRDATHQQVLNKNGDNPLGVAGAARNVDDRRVDAVLLEELLNAKSARGVGASSLPTTVASARAVGDDCLSGVSSLKKDVGTLLVSNAKCVAVPALNDCTLVDYKVATGCNRLLTSLLHRMASRCGKRLAVVQRKQLQDNGRHIRSIDLSKSLSAARARSALKPDDGLQIALGVTDDALKSLGNLGSGGLGKTDHRGDTSAIAEELTTANATGLQNLSTLADLIHLLCCHSYTSLSN